MANGEDWLWRPVARQMCRAESILDGSLSLAVIADLNECIDVNDENAYRLRKAMERG
jgi:hypothetical protein